jgi:hypothetical protein
VKFKPFVDTQIVGTAKIGLFLAKFQGQASRFTVQQLTC